jgi:hypothetical protein
MKNCWFSLICLLLFASCKDISDLTDVKVTGQVLNATTKAPLDSVTVNLYEDNDGAFMGMHLLQTVTTGNSGDFSFNFTYREGPYKIYVYRNGYVYQRLVKDKILNKEMIFDYQSVESLKNEQHMVFEMDPVALLSIKLINSAPAFSTDQIKLEIGKGVNNQPIFTRTFDGLVNTDFQVGNVPANRFVPIKYEVRENGVWRSERDSVLLQPSEVKSFTVQY